MKRRKDKAVVPPAQPTTTRALEPSRGWWTWLASIAPTPPRTQWR